MQKEEVGSNNYFYLSNKIDSLLNNFLFSKYISNFLFPVFLADNSGKILEKNSYCNGIIESNIKEIFPQWDTSKERESTEINKNDCNFCLSINKISFFKKRCVYICYMTNIQEKKNLELKFAHSQKMQMIGQLSGGIAHDFNNLLTAIIGFCDLLLLKHPSNDSSFSDLMHIKQNANRAANLVSQLLALSKKQLIKPQILNVSEVVTEVSYLIRRLIGENIELNISCERDTFKVKIDKGQLEQVLINVAVNARDAMPKGGLLRIKVDQIELNKENKDAMFIVGDEKVEKGRYTLIEVADHGHGMDSRTISRIFEPFFSTKEMGSGVGLGLSTVFSIVKDFGGYIAVNSVIGHGTTFSIFLRQATETDCLIDSDKLLKGESKMEDLTGNANILLIEDELPVRIFVKSALTNKGYNVIETESTGDAMKVFKERKDEVDIIISDVIMPGVTGIELVSEMEKINPNVKTIFISGYTKNEFDGDLYKNRNFIFLAKPFTLKELTSAVKNSIEQKVGL